MVASGGGEEEAGECPQRFHAGNLYLRNSFLRHMKIYFSSQQKERERERVRFIYSHRRRHRSPFLLSSTFCVNLLHFSRYCENVTKAIY